MLNAAQIIYYILSQDTRWHFETREIIEWV